MSKEVGIKEEEVEEWIITALTKGILRGQIDQVNSQFILLGVKPTELDKKYWKYAGEKVGHWKEKFESI